MQVKITAVPTSTSRTYPCLVQDNQGNVYLLCKDTNKESKVWAYGFTERYAYPDSDSLFNNRSYRPFVGSVTITE